MERYRFVEANSIEASAFKRPLDETLRTIPKRISSPFCKSSDERPSWDDIMKRDDFEEYLSINEETRYRISSFYLMGTPEIRVKFQGVGYGDFTVCMSREHSMLSKECKSVLDMGYAWFNITRPCQNQNTYEPCSGVYFSLQVETTYMKCSEADCRFHDDVRVIVRPENLRCESSGLRKFTASIILLVFSLLVVVTAA